MLCTAAGGEERGYDAGQKIIGRKRRLAVDTLGLALVVVVHGACWQDHEGACFVLVRLKQKFKRLKVLFADAAYRRHGLPCWVKDAFGWVPQTMFRPKGAKGFVVLPKRWIGERTFASMDRSRRHSKDEERKTENSEAMIHLTMIRLMTKRLATPKKMVFKTRSQW